MQLQLLSLLAILGATNAHNVQRHANLAKRQAAASSAATAGATSSSSAAAAASGSTSAAAPAGTAASPSTGLTASGVPALDSLTSGMPTGTTQALSTTYTAGQSVPISGADPLPTAFTFNAADWPELDKRPPVDSDEVKEWMKELDGFDIPDLQPTTDGTCASDPTFAADAANRGWWTCGHHTRSTDILSCPQKNTWGVSFDDGPSDYTPKLLSYLAEKDIKSTFFVVGSRVVSRPQTLIDEYMSGHEISVHTWAHPSLTTLTNEQIVAELGWTRKAIKEVLGVTPTTMRPPYGDIDDRVRAISLAMGLVPIIWTSTDTLTFDTNDWKVAGGLVTGSQSYETFQAILGNATNIDTGIIVLQHDLYEIAVDLAVGYTIQSALNANYKLEAIGTCQGFPAGDMYLETTSNTTFPYTNSTDGGVDTDGDGSPDTTSGATGGSNSTSGGSGSGNGALAAAVPAFSTFVVLGMTLLGSMLL